MSGFVLDNLHILLLFSIFNSLSNSQCSLSPSYQKKIFSIEDGLDTSTTIGPDFILESQASYDGLCEKILYENRTLWNNVEDVTVIYKNKTKSCYYCYDFVVRSENVLQYRRTQCKTASRSVDLNTFFERTCSSLTNTEWETGFVENKEDYSDFNCKSIIEGVFSFEYRITSSTGVCQSPNSYIRACQRQGSPLRDNSVFKMRFGYCPNFQDISVLQDPNIIFGKENIFYCYGRWVDNEGNIYAAIGYDIKESRYRFRCMTTRIDQQKVDNSQDWGITNNADCKKLFSYKESDIRLYLFPDFDPDTQLTELQSSCRLPTNFSGQWFYPSEYYTTLNINSTNIVMRRRLDNFVYEDIYFACKQMQDDRYLMTVITKGKCEVDYMCFEFLPRHQNIIRFRMGRPYPLYYKDRNSLGAEYEGRLFRDACYWSSFTLNYIEWTYEYFILNPPIPINCPIQGKFKIEQRGQDAEKYIFKIPGGMTPRPWLQVLCRDFWSGNIEACLTEPKALQLDSSKCWRLDYTGRPYSEYNVVDNYLTCVGFWMEDTKSFLITHDKEDPVLENFRCWVYKRLSYNNYVMSRGRGSQCEKMQTAESSLPSEGASLLLELTQDENLFDVCPMGYDDGQDPYASNAIMEVFSGSWRNSIAISAYISLIFIFCYQLAT